MQNRISDFEFLHSSLRFAIGRTARSIALAIIRVLRPLAPGLVRELALEALQPRAAERPTDRSVDDLLAYAVATDTRLRFFRSDVIVFAGASCALARVDELRAARAALAKRIEDLFGVDVPGSSSDVAARAARANACTARPIEFEPDRDWSPPEELVRAPWEVDAESIPQRREHERERSCDADRSCGTAPAGDAIACDAPSSTPPLPRPRGGARDSNVPPRQDEPTASQETPQ